ncbi:hydroxymethylpyrimidine/phosphomethylpyrimidine kinase [Chromobacterium subtsugae]|uniref:hydroxymethylpyrimidine kinase n=1 Tax=Chromobacterium subtsugae TaxID=251747 RepID=A0ABS7F7N7_9NEIS|nr:MULTISPECIES: hydroxymethylpyrimidine/phosphomethylpyrimidine kinase [Chromobacterium]KUM02104.1 phosphomethylpyrimidine kinase [Chromobacterium subtsugae]KZE83169.1 hydroxymethylpyrimidine/phosphomethylpyrimidine kinase [Chromobacterium sp. F49]MBW7567128.1 hydroxymethylpyrimidine/phosphomethylpyrimidine kinase [Chromobacterium subtsugae]MBW8286098.1 hydroxymethylpyrimidine/phosphomethylpyrimidine kinase [Chromobacterium subtsugae]WSE91846.1 hydroxymethylpyrimidine/phosphomethylpyrimidine 
MTTPPSPPVVLTLAGSDPSGGAGIQADILTLASLGCHPLSVITAITVQDTVGVNDLMVLDADWVNDQARFLMEDMPVAAFKIGMLGSVENVAVVAQLLADYPDIPVVLDPVLASGGGHELADEDLIGAMRDILIPQVSILTPNSLEARRLASNDPDDDEELTLDQCAERILALGCPYLLITGTHENTKEVVNSLYSPDGVVRADHWERLPGSYHGSGCTLASAIAGMLATGLLLPEAVREAQEYTYQTLLNGFRPGMGQFLPDRMFWARGDDEDSDGKPD